MQKQKLIEQVIQTHTRTFGSAPSQIAWAPGRIEVLGNHTDYNEGTVLSAAIDLGHVFAISRSRESDIHIHAADVHQTAQFDASNTQKVPGCGWADYVKGVFHLVGQHTGHTITGLNGTFLGSIPMGSGLSSSAALEVAAAFAVQAFMGISIPPKEIARICRQAEHEFAGANCGLLDQYSSIFGENNSLIHTDFRTLEVCKVPLPEDTSFLVINPRVQHSLVHSPYNERRERCEQAAQQFATLLPHPVTALRDVSWSEVEAFGAQIDPAALQRARHVVGEIDRVERGRQLLAEGHLQDFGHLLFASHQSSIDYFENSCPELDTVVTIARQAGALGARLSGGGFGGSAIALVASTKAPSVAAQIAERCAAKGLHPDILAVTPSQGAHVI